MLICVLSTDYVRPESLDGTLPFLAGCSVFVLDNPQVVIQVIAHRITYVLGLVTIILDVIGNNTL